MYRTKQIVLEDEAQRKTEHPYLSDDYISFWDFFLPQSEWSRLIKYITSRGGGADNVSTYLLRMGVQTPLANMKINLEDSQVSGTSFASRSSRCMTTLGYMNRELYILLERQFFPMFITTRNQKQHWVPSVVEWIMKMWHIIDTMKYN